MHRFACLLAIAALPLAVAEDEDLRSVRGEVSVHEGRDGEPRVEFRSYGRTARAFSVKPTSPANRQLIRAAKASPGPFHASASCALYLNLEGKTVGVIKELHTPHAPKRTKVELTATGFKLEDGRALAGCGPLADLLGKLQAPGARCEVRAQILEVNEDRLLHVTGIMAYPLPGTILRLESDSADRLGVPAEGPFWITKAPKARKLQGETVMSVRGLGSGSLQVYARLSDLAISAPLKGKVCVSFGMCAPPLPAERAGVEDALQQR